MLLENEMAQGCLFVLTVRSGAGRLFGGNRRAFPKAVHGQIRAAAHHPEIWLVLKSSPIARCSCAVRSLCVRVYLYRPLNVKMPERVVYRLWNAVSSGCK